MHLKRSAKAGTFWDLATIGSAKAGTFWARGRKRSAKAGTFWANEGQSISQIRDVLGQTTDIDPRKPGRFGQESRFRSAKSRTFWANSGPSIRQTWDVLGEIWLDLSLTIRESRDVLGKQRGFDPPNPGRFGQNQPRSPKKAGTFWALIRESRDVLGSDPRKPGRFGRRSAESGTFWDQGFDRSIKII